MYKHFECEVHTEYEKKTFRDKLELYGHLATVPRRKLIEYCISMQNCILEVDEFLRQNGVTVTFDYDNKPVIEIERK